jgi:O-antigen/teichoic acid export membrane protein
MRGLLVFGGEVTAARLLWTLYSQADVFIVGKLLGKELLGVYAVAVHLASLPVKKISSVVNQVAFPAFAAAQGNKAAIPANMLQAVSILGFCSFPLLWGLSALAPEIVDVLLGVRWAAAVLPLQWLPLVMPLTILGPFLNTAMQGLGQSRTVLYNSLTAFLLLPAAFVVGAQWGLPGLCASWMFGYPMVLMLNMRRMLPSVGLSVKQVTVATMKASTPAIGMYVAILLVRQVIGGDLSAPLRLVLLALAGVASFFAIAWFTHRETLLRLLAALRRTH